MYSLFAEGKASDGDSVGDSDDIGISEDSGAKCYEEMVIVMINKSNLGRRERRSRVSCRRVFAESPRERQRCWKKMSGEGFRR